MCFKQLKLQHTSPHLSSSCPLAHKAPIHCLHLCLSLATVLADAQLFQPSFVRSCSVVLLHVVLGRPTFLLPSGCHVKAVVHIRVLSILSTWPIHPHFLFATLSLTFDVLVFRSSSSFEIFSGHLILSICLRHLFWKVSSFFLSCSVVFQVSLPYVKTDSTKLLYSFTFVWMENFEEFHIFLSLPNCALAFPNLLVMSSSQPPVDVTTPPRYMYSHLQ